MEATTQIHEEVMTLAENIVDVARGDTERDEVILLVACSLEPLHEYIESLKKRLEAGGETLTELRNGIDELGKQMERFQSDFRSTFSPAPVEPPRDHGA